MSSCFFFKIGCAIVVFVTAFLGGVIPIRLTKYFPEQKTLSAANSLSAGILIGASLTHLLPDSEEFRIEYEYPLAHLVCAVGFFVALILEKILFSHSHDDNGHNKQAPRTLDEQVELTQLKHREHQEEEQEMLQAENKSVLLEEVDVNEISESDNHGHKEGHGTSSYVLFSILALESFMSGSALGVSNTSMGVLVVFIAIVTHLWAESFALCASMLKSKFVPGKIYKLIALFSAVTPLGVLVGIGLQSVLEGKVALIISSIFIAFAAGTFLYIAIVEIVAEELATEENKWTKLNLMLIGFVFMASLALWI